VTEISAGAGHTLVRLSDGSAWGWGANGNGQVGDGTRTDRSTAVRVIDSSTASGFLEGVKTVAAGGGHSLALDAAGVKSWGGKDLGELGIGVNAIHTLPVQVLDPTDPTGNLTGVLDVGWLQRRLPRAEAGSDGRPDATVVGTERRWGTRGWNAAKPAVPTAVLLNNDGVLTTSRRSARAVAMRRHSRRRHAPRMGTREHRAAWRRVAPAALRVQGDSRPGLQRPGVAGHGDCPLARPERRKGMGVRIGSFGQLGQGPQDTTTKFSPVAVKDAAGTGLLTDVTVIAAGDNHRWPSSPTKPFGRGARIPPDSSATDPR